MTHTKATKLKIAAARKGKKHKPETIEKIRQAMRERGELMRQGLLPAYKHSDATRAKMRKAAKHRKPSKQALKNSAEVRRTHKEGNLLRKKLKMPTSKMPVRANS